MNKSCFLFHPTNRNNEGEYSSSIFRPSVFASMHTNLRSSCMILGSFQPVKLIGYASWGTQQPSFNRVLFAVHFNPRKSMSHVDNISSLKKLQDYIWNIAKSGTRLSTEAVGKWIKSDKGEIWNAYQSMHVLSIPCPAEWYSFCTILSIP